ncbi:MAG: hypothetical protein IPJ26_16360 [Bacteroidetes bacterium]|nr:hypothetical protein [Bacteroidota bacterium]
MKKSSLVALALIAIITTAFKPIQSKLVSKDAHVVFFSHTALEDISANNYKVVSTLTKLQEIWYILYQCRALNLKKH